MSDFKQLEPYFMHIDFHHYIFLRTIKNLPKNFQVKFLLCMKECKFTYFISSMLQLHIFSLCYHIIF